MVNTRTRSADINSQQGSSLSGPHEVPDSQFEAGSATIQGAQETPQSDTTHEAIMATVERLVRERLAQEQRPQHIPPVHVMRGNKPQLYYGKSRSEFEEFVRVCESNFLSAHWGPDQNIDKIAYATGFLMGTPASEWKSYKFQVDIMTVTWDQLKELLISLLGDKTNVKSRAIDEWYNARQRPTQTIRAYAAYLDELATRLSNPPTTADRLQKLRSSMKDSIRAVIQAQVIQPSTRADLVAQAQQIEENEIVRTRAPNSYDRIGDSQRSSAPGPHRSQRDGRTSNRYDPTRGRNNRNRERDKDRSRSDQTNHRVKLSPEELERRKKEKLCFHCGKGNHVSKDCFSRKREKKERNDTSTRTSDSKSKN